MPSMIQPQALRLSVGVVACAAAAYFMALITAIVHLHAVLWVAAATCLLIAGATFARHLRQSSVAESEVDAIHRLFKLAFVAILPSFLLFWAITYFGMVPIQRSSSVLLLLALLTLVVGWRSWQFAFFRYIDRAISHLERNDLSSGDGS